MDKDEETLRSIARSDNVSVVAVVGFFWQSHQQATNGAWTKVPLFSDEVSRAITSTYVDDFYHGIPMGTWKLYKPPLASPKAASARGQAHVGSELPVMSSPLASADICT